MKNLYNGDCKKIISKLNVNHVLTSPPYNRKRNDKYKNYNDNIDNYFEFITGITYKLLKITSGFVFMNLQANYYNKADVYRYIGEFANVIQQIIIWEKSNPLPANGNNITNSYEYIIVIGNNNLKSNATYTKNHITTSINTDCSKIHKAVMKLCVAEWLIENFTKENDVILDPFMGLGTTGIACKKLSREFIGIELDKEYFEIAKKRIEETKAQLRLF